MAVAISVIDNLNELFSFAVNGEVPGSRGVMRRRGAGEGGGGQRGDVNFALPLSLTEVQSLPGVGKPNYNYSQTLAENSRLSFFDSLLVIIRRETKESDLSIVSVQYCSLIFI